jgi:hypothetical protein
MLSEVESIDVNGLQEGVERSQLCCHPVHEFPARQVVVGPDNHGLAF